MSSRPNGQILYELIIKLDSKMIQSVVTQNKNCVPSLHPILTYPYKEYRIFLKQKSQNRFWKLIYSLP